MLAERRKYSTQHWKQVRPSQVGNLRMNLLMWCTLVLFLCLSSEEMAEAKREPAIGQLYRVKKGQYMVRNSKRHSDGTFTSDFTRYLDKIKAKDFVEWLTSTKREGCHEDQFHVAAGV